MYSINVVLENHSEFLIVLTEWEKLIDNSFDKLLTGRTSSSQRQSPGGFLKS